VGLAGAASGGVSLLVLYRSRSETSNLLRQALARFDSRPSESASPRELVVELSNCAEQVRESANAMQADRERLSAILSSMTEGVIAIDRSENIVLANDASLATMDKVPEQPLGRPLRELVRNVQIHEYVRAVLKGQSSSPIECELARSNRIVTVKADAIGDQEPTGAVLTIHDISELRRLERIRREFVANVSHELKTPLTVIQACADTLADGAIEEPEPAKRFLNRIDEQCGRLAELINDMLDLARIEAGTEIVERKDVDVERVLRECVQQREHIAVNKQLAMTVKLLDSPVTIQSDLTAIRTLVGNLADNAIKYTPQGGSVSLELDCQDDDVIIRVRDTGIGIEREHINRIFQRFYRVDSARSRDSGGSGLGLAIVKHLVQQLGGSIEVESEPGAGTTFSVALPQRISK
ncbi:MAG: sensor histidine kinase, partial [Planctomycetaceae bacterium]